MIAAAGASTFPSRFVSRRLPVHVPAAGPLRSCSIWLSRTLGDAVRRSTLARSGTRLARRSVVAALFIADTTPAGVVRPFGRAAFSSCTRCTDPYDQLSSAAANAVPGLLFQFTIWPLGGSIAWT